MSKEKIRCPWVGNDQKMIKYHDELWGVPVYDDQELFKRLSLESMQAGLSWRTILHKKENFEKAFDNFEIKKVAKYDEQKYEELMQDAGIVRNKLKIRAIINNANRFLEIQKEFGSFSNYIWHFTDGEIIYNHFKTFDDFPTSTPLSDQISKDLLKRGFKFVGTTIIYSFLETIGIVNDHMTMCFKYKKDC